jgi:predicted ester cyclase
MRKLNVVCLVVALCSCLAFAKQREPKSHHGGDNEKNEAIASQVITDVVGRGDFETGQRLFEPESITHFGDKSLSLRAAIEEAQSWRRVAPDFRMKVDSVESRGDRVTVHWTATGTNTGTGEGIPEPTGKHIKTHGESEFRFANGKIAESWLRWNEDEVRRQLVGGDRDDKHEKHDK